MPKQRTRSTHKAKIHHAKLLKFLLVFSAAMKISVLFMWQANPLEFPRAEKQLPGRTIRLRCTMCEGHPNVLRNRPGKAWQCDQQRLWFLLAFNKLENTCMFFSNLPPPIDQCCCSLNNTTSRTRLKTQPYLCQLTSRADRLQMKSCFSLSTCRMWREIERQERNRRPW